LIYYGYLIDYYFLLLLNMASSLRIFGNSILRLSGHSFRYSNVIFHNCGDIHRFAPIPKFEGVKNIVFDKCDKNFVYYWLSEAIFQKFENIDKIMLNSHPCEKNVFMRIGREKNENRPTVFVHNRYSDLVNRWAFFDYDKKKPMKNIVTVDNYINLEMQRMALDSDSICEFINKETRMIETYYTQQNKSIYKLVETDKVNSLKVPITRMLLLNTDKFSIVDDNLYIYHNDGKVEKLDEIWPQSPNSIIM
jgi:hypothetical protein